jgi:hypothetical protein
MSNEYPIRSKCPKWASLLCVAHGTANIVGGVIAGVAGFVFPSIAGLLVGVIFVGFGVIGGIPLIATVRDWHPMSPLSQITEVHLRGLRVLRRRRLVMWATPLSLLYFAAFQELFGRHIPEEWNKVHFLAFALVVFVLFFLFPLSRCPRCGYGFCALSASRAAGLWPTNFCRHCQLTLRGTNDWE